VKPPPPLYRVLHNTLRRLRYPSLRVMFTVPVLIQLTLAVGLVGALSFRNGQRAVQSLASQLRSEISARIEGELSSYFGDPHAINRLNATAFSSGDIDINGASYGEHLMFQQMKIYPNIAFVYCGSARSGEFFGVLRVPETGELQLSYGNRQNDFLRDYYTLDVRGNRQHFARQATERYDARLRPWFQAALTEEQPAWTDVYLAFTTGLPNVTASLPVYDDQGRQLLGVCAADVVLPEEFRDFLSQLNIGKSGHAFVVDRQGNLISSSTEEPLMLEMAGKAQFLKAVRSRDPLVQRSADYLLDRFGSFDRIRQSQQLSFTLDGQRQYLEVLPFSDGFGLDWLIVVVVPESDIMGQIHTNTRITIALCGIALIVALAVGIVSTRRITAPILSLNRAVKEIARGRWDQPLPSHRPDEVGQLAKSVDNMAAKLQQTFGRLEAQKNAFARFFPPEYLTFFNKQSVTDVQLGDYVSQDMAVLFADIRRFTSMIETMPPGELAAFMNTYLQSISPEIRRHGGFVVKFIGDSIMAVFPNRVEDAIAAALGQFDQMRAYNTKVDRPVQIGMGLHTGPMMLGIIGEPTRMQGDALSDTVNLAARLEGLSKLYQAHLVISKDVLHQLEHPEQFTVRFLDRVMVKGRNGRLDIYEVLDAELPDQKALKLKTQPLFAQAIDLYRDRQWLAAQDRFRQILALNPTDGAALLYLDRLSLLQIQGAAADWDGVWAFTQKR
jgi:class 3 adenylate cyclase/HAMP domain-containing protein